MQSDLTHLDLLLALAQHGPKALQAISGGNVDNEFSQIVLRGVDWNIPLAMANEWMDRVVAVAKIEEPMSARVRLRSWNGHSGAGRRRKDPWGIAGAVLSRDRASEKVGEV